MGWRDVIRRSAFAAAILAVALLSLATTRSVVMQIADTAPGMTSITCMNMAAAHAKGGAHLPDQAHKVCDYCAAAAHAPVCDSPLSVPSPSAVTWAAYPIIRPLGPRGPPAFAPNARGPPQAALTI